MITLSDVKAFLTFHSDLFVGLNIISDETLPHVYYLHTEYADLNVSLNFKFHFEDVLDLIIIDESGNKDIYIAREPIHLNYLLSYLETNYSLIPNFLPITPRKWPVIASKYKPDRKYHHRNKKIA